MYCKLINVSLPSGPAAQFRSATNLQNHYIMKNFLRIVRNCTAVLAILLAPIISAAQAPPLGTTANFVLFTSTGAVGNTGISQLTGNVGTNSGAITGFGNVNGEMHSGDLTTGQAAADLTIAYNALNSAIPTGFRASPLGNNDTLTAGVYGVTGVSVLSGTLVLNGLGDTNAVFIFQLSAAFSSTTNSAIQLINGAQACNVFWKIEGAVNLATGTNMKGTIVVNNASIAMSSADTLEGRALTTTGGITINNVMAYTPTGCGSPQHNGPAAPVLGSVECFAIFSGNGPVTNAGPTFATGDIGTNVGLTTGYNPLNVTGMIHPIPDAATASAINDLVIAYTYLNTLPTDIELLYPAQFGNGLTLTPHTYLLNAATALTNSVFLNAEGNPDAVFVIKINGALSTSTFSKVILTNGAQAKNVYWKVDGAVTINDYSLFNGTIVSNNGAINLNTGDTVNGRALTTNGAVSTAAVMVTSPIGPCFALPLTWLSFSGQSLNGTVPLQWTTTNEVNNAFFDIEKSNDGLAFETVASVNAVAKSGATQNTYTYTDTNPFAVGYYRIAQIDLGGQRSYSHTIQVGTTDANAFDASHYTTGNFINIQTLNAAPGNATIDLYNVVGQQLLSEKITLSPAQHTYQINKPAQPGIYLLRITTAREVLYNTKLSVQ